MSAYEQGTYLRVDPHTAGIISTENQVQHQTKEIQFDKSLIRIVFWCYDLVKSLYLRDSQMVQNYRWPLTVSYNSAD